MIITTARRKWRVGLFFFAAMLFLFGCDNHVEQRAAQFDKRIVVGIDAYPPFSYIDENGDSIGIDADLAREAFGRMGYRAEIVRINWEEKDKLLDSGSIDCIWSCFSMNGREDKYLWAGPYILSRQVVAVNPGSDIYSLKDMAGKSIAVQSTTKPEGYFMNPAGDTVHVKQVYSFFDRDLIYLYLAKGYVDAIGAHETVIEQYMKDYHTNFRIVDEPIMVARVGVAFSLNDKRGIAGELQKTIDAMRKDGATAAILKHYVNEPQKYLEGIGLDK